MSWLVEGRPVAGRASSSEDTNRTGTKLQTRRIQDPDPHSFSCWIRIQGLGVHLVKVTFNIFEILFLYYFYEKNPNCSQVLIKS